MPAVAPAPTEKEFQTTLVRTLEVLGWHVNHVFPLRTKHGWRTGTTAEGWPDLFAVRGPWAIAIEVKSDKGRLRAEQRVWLQRLALIPSIRSWVIRPRDDYSQLVSWLRDPEHAPRVFGWQPTTQEDS